MKRTILIAGLLMFLQGPRMTAAGAQETSPLLAQIECVAAPEGVTSPAVSKSIADQIESRRQEVVTPLLAKLQDPAATEKQLAVYVWALGLAKDPGTVEAIIRLYRQSRSDLVRGNCLRALAMIGGTPAGEFLLSTVKAAPDANLRFNSLNLLGQMQYAPALPETAELLRQEPKNGEWQCIFVFGKMGDKAVPFLLKRITDPDLHVRTNATVLLGQWLIAPEAAKPLLDRYWQENDVELRGWILNSLTRTIPDLDQMKRVFEQVGAKEKNDDLLIFVRKTLATMDGMKAEALASVQTQTVPAYDFMRENPFTREYAKLFKSAGKDGNYEILAAYCSAGDDARLKALRERILQRDSDEAFDDYQKVNGIIIRNRLATRLKNQHAANQPATGDGK